MTPRTHAPEQVHDTVPTPAPPAITFNWGVLSALAKDGGIVVALIWYLWFSTTTTLPQMQEKFHDLVKAERENFRVEIGAQRAFEERRHTEQVQAIREVGRDILRELRRGRGED